MPDNPLVVALLKEYAAEGSITRPEVGEIIGKTLGQVAGIHTRNKKKIGPWPKFDTPERKARKQKRGCQFPLGQPGEKDFHLCSKRRAEGHSLLCDEHKDKKWQPRAKVVPMAK